ncbi:MAG: type II secretion system protein GspG [Verrucomicrobia bacterium]|jgi:prepilin-type N-terminal cleavage/methylation domain-containing protein|nr:type II secretion system protein GspG [Verrucomicrobiota bacterium]
MDKKEKGFTLLELFSVIALIGILMSIAFPITSYVLDSIDEKNAKSELTVLRMAIEEFKAERGDFPNCPAKICSTGECLFLSLMGYHNENGLQIPPSPSLVNPTNFYYGPMDMEATELEGIDPSDSENSIALISFALSQDVAFCDPWGNNYMYQFPRKDGLAGFRLFSLGPDGKMGEGRESDDLE